MINYAWPVTTIDRNDLFKIDELINKYSEVLKQKQIVIFGAGIRGTIFSVILSKRGYTNIVFTDNNKEKVGNVINEFPIISYEEIENRKDEVFVIVSVEECDKICEQLVNSRFEEGCHFVRINAELYEQYVDNFMIPGDLDAIVMGDCGLVDISQSDNNYENVSEMIQRKLPNKKVKVLAIHAMGMRAFYHILKAHIDNVAVPKQVSIMANFETFTGKQHLLPRSQHARLMELLYEQLPNKDKELQEYCKVTKERVSDFHVDYFGSSKRNQGEMNSSKNDKLVMRMNYMYILSEDCEPIRYISKIKELCKSKSVKLSFFIPPANYMYAETFFGAMFREKYEANVKRLVEIIGKDVEVWDLSYILSDKEFAAPTTIDETANYFGREKFSDEIVKGIQRISDGI